VSPLPAAGAVTPADLDAVADGDRRLGGRPFEVHLENFEGPFDLLLSLIAKHKMDVTEVALSRVTDEFIAYIRRSGAAWDLAAATEFLVVAATLLDLKAARLLPSAAVEDEEDLALLEARDLLFARLLQYRAYKLAAVHLGDLERAQARRFARTAALEPRYAEVLPDVLLGIGLDRFVALAVRALTPRTAPVVDVEHLHVARVSVQEHAADLRARLSVVGAASFRSLVSDCGSTLEVVARFLALLELYRDGAVAFDQVVPLGDLRVRWTGHGEAGQRAYDAYGGDEGELT
jgi:segregation and condensation protein A